jgi:5-methylcytosine-specific restriction protein A
MSAFPLGFNAAIDRFDKRSAARLFKWFWPDAITLRGGIVNLAASIRAAHQAGEASWGLTMQADHVRLNVGPCEALTFLHGESQFLVANPEELGHDCEFDSQEEPFYYRSVPILSKKCLIGPVEIRNAHNAYIEAAVDRRRVCSFQQSFSPAVLEFIEDILGEVLPRPGYLVAEKPFGRVQPLPDEVDNGPQWREGSVYQVMVNAYERNPEARQECIRHYGTRCAVCGFDFGIAYGPVAAGLIHVHHLKPISDMGGEYQVDPINDLRPVCPNCHAVIHLGGKLRTIEEVQGLLTPR